MEWWGISCYNTVNKERKLSIKMINYIFLILASFLFSMQFLFHKKFLEENGESMDTALKFTVWTSICSFLILLVQNKFHIAFSWFSFGISVAYVAVTVTSSYATVKSLSVVNLSLFSVCTMLGGMALPVLYGVLFKHEPFTGIKFICCVLMAVAMFLSVSDTKSQGKSAMLWYCLVFVLNGLDGVLATIHQNAGEINVDSRSFMCIKNILTMLTCVAWLLIRNKRLAKVSVRSVMTAGGYAALNSTGGLLMLTALLALPASVQYPIVTGGTMVFAALIGFFRKEPFTKKNAVALALSLLASVVIAL